MRHGLDEREPVGARDRVVRRSDRDLARALAERHRVARLEADAHRARARPVSNELRTHVESVADTSHDERGLVVRAHRRDDDRRVVVAVALLVRHGAHVERRVDGIDRVRADAELDEERLRNAPRGARGGEDAHRVGGHVDRRAEPDARRVARRALDHGHGSRFPIRPLVHRSREHRFSILTVLTEAQRPRKHEAAHGAEEPVGVCARDGYVHSRGAVVLRDERADRRGDALGALALEVRDVVVDARLPRPGRLDGRDVRVQLPVGHGTRGAHGVHLVERGGPLGLDAPRAEVRRRDRGAEHRDPRPLEIVRCARREKARLVRRRRRVVRYPRRAQDPERRFLLRARGARERRHDVLRQMGDRRRTRSESCRKRLVEPNGERDRDVRRVVARTRDCYPAHQGSFRLLSTLGFLFFFGGSQKNKNGGQKGAKGPPKKKGQRAPQKRGAEGAEGAEGPYPKNKSFF